MSVAQGIKVLRGLGEGRGLGGVRRGASARIGGGSGVSEEKSWGSWGKKEGGGEGGAGEGGLACKRGIQFGGTWGG